ncbi:hypothetical protein HZB00_00440 [Candidatus Woesearchaeota archaeon]|nr:hypothetical protein [Candidatus Woesearchaeota archaeon]
MVLIPADQRIDRDATLLFQQIKKLDLSKLGLNFLGSSPPELFVGKFNYPNVYTGILAPIEHDEEASVLSNPEEWFSQRLSIQDILSHRGSMVYSRFTSNIKKPNEGKLLGVMQEVSMASKPCDVEFLLKKKPVLRLDFDSRSHPVGNPAPLEKATLTHNPSIPTKVEKIVTDTDLKAKEGIIALYQHAFTVSSLIKLLSAGLLGIQKQRILVPSRWSVTAVDDMLSKFLLEDIKEYQSISTFQVFYDEYLGNHYEILLLPRPWSFEVIETRLPSSLTSWRPVFWKDSETIYGRTTYADSVTGAYYANRLGVCEYLKKIKLQASVLVMREVRPEYTAPLGVGILREVTRGAFTKKPLTFSTLKEATDNIQIRLLLPVEKFLEGSLVFKEFKQQRTLFSYF